MRNDAVDFENLFIRVSLGDVKLSHHSRPVALAAAAEEDRTIRQSGTVIISNDVNRFIEIDYFSPIAENSDTHIHTHLPSEAMRSSDHPGAVHQNPSAHQATI